MEQEAAGRSLGSEIVRGIGKEAKGALKTIAGSALVLGALGAGFGAFHFGAVGGAVGGGVGLIAGAILAVVFVFTPLFE